MTSEVTIIGEAFRMRPIRLTDANFVHTIRTNPALNKYIGETPGGQAAQEEWLREYSSRKNDYYFIIERIDGETAVGTIGIYNFDLDAKSAEWGRWLILPGSLAAVESALLLYRFAFNYLKLKKVYCRTISNNKLAHSFHTSCGLTTDRELISHIEISGVIYDALEQSLSVEKWPVVEKKLSKLARAVAKKFQND